MQPSYLTSLYLNFLKQGQKYLQNGVNNFVIVLTYALKYNRNLSLLETLN